MNCTLFAIAAAELDPSPETSLPGYDDASASRTGARYDHSSALPLGAKWQALHVALGNRDGDHPLAFLVAGGEERTEFGGGSSSGRYFAYERAVHILAALARMPRPAPEIERVRIFVADAVANGRGLVVHHFR